MFFFCFALYSFAQEAPPHATASGQSTAPAQNPPITLTPRSREEREERYRLEHRILLNVLVTDASGTPVTGLTAKDFTMLDNGQPQTILSVRAVVGSKGIAPVRIILMLDAVNNSPREVAIDRRGVERFLKRSQARLTYPTAIAVLTASGVRMSTASTDRDALIVRLPELTKEIHGLDCDAFQANTEQALSAGLSGQSGASNLDVGIISSPKGNCLNQRFHQSVAVLHKLAHGQEDVLGRVILIWIGRGWPLLLEKEFRADTASLRQNFFDNLVAVSNDLREGQVTLDAVFSPDLFRTVELRTDHDNTFFEGVPSEADVTASSLGLQVLAHQSGGQILLNGKDLGGEIAKCIADADFYYALSFNSPSSITPGEFHSIKVNTNEPGLKIRTNTVYYAEP
jgi:VWFA-related protein